MGVDTIVLACTHYAFIIPSIEEMFGSVVTVIDPSPAIARQTKRLLDERRLRTEVNKLGEITYISTKNAADLVSIALALIVSEGSPSNLTWEGTQLRE
jgi:glutamate racemase